MKSMIQPWQLWAVLSAAFAALTAIFAKLGVEQINSDADRDRWFTAQEALEYGFIDHVVETAHAVTGRGGTA